MSDTRSRDEERERAIRVEDRRHWARDPDGSENAEADEAAGADAEREEHLEVVPTEELKIQRERAEAAERKLQEFAAAYQQFRAEQEQVRARLERDVESKVELRFGVLVAGLLEAVDDLDRALEHARDIPEAAPLARGVELARDRFLADLLKSGVERLDLTGSEFDPNVAEAVSLEPVDDRALDGRVVTTLRPGYRLGERVVRPARVTVGRSRE